MTTDAIDQRCFSWLCLDMLEEIDLENLHTATWCGSHGYLLPSQRAVELTSWVLFVIVNNGPSWFILADHRLMQNTTCWTFFDYNHQEPTGCTRKVGIFLFPHEQSKVDNYIPGAGYEAWTQETLSSFSGIQIPLLLGVASLLSHGHTSSFEEREITVLK